MASISSSYNSLLHSSTHPAFFSSSEPTPPSFLTFRRPTFSPSAAATCADFQTESATASFSLASPSTSSFYDLLGIPAGATTDEIKAAYRRLARACHPDVAESDQKESSANEFIRIHTAYSTLSDPEKRADYDRRLLRRRRSAKIYSGVSASPALARMSRFTRRNWETDQCW